MSDNLGIWGAAAGNYLTICEPTRDAATSIVLEAFANVQRLTRRDQEITCIDMSPVAEWWQNARPEELDNLIESTPIRLPFPAAVAGFVHPDPVPTNGWRISLVQILRESSTLLAIGEYLPDAGVMRISRGWRIPLYEDGRARNGVLMRNTPAPDAFTQELTVIGLAMFHVRNVGLRPVALPRFLRRRIKRDAAIEGPQVYHTLTLRPFAQREEGDDKRTPTGERPLHLVRGHFAHYTQARPLFGKYVGTFWRPEHEAGNRSVAVVRKTFQFDLETVPGDATG